MPSTTRTTSSVDAAAWVSPDDGWLSVGESILGTSDAGATWSRLSTLDADVRALSFVDLDHGWAATSRGLYSTKDGGHSWAKVATGGATDLARVDFVDALHGWVLPETTGDVARVSLLRTSDGGRTWSSLAMPCDTRFGVADSFVGQSLGWLACASEPGAGSQAKYLYRTDDGAAHWRLVSQTSLFPANALAPKTLPTSGYVSDLYFRDESHGWLATLRGGLLHTVDGGKTWKPLASLYGERFPSGPRFFSEERGYVLDEVQGRTVLLGTRDSGNAWRQIYPAP